MTDFTIYQRPHKQFQRLEFYYFKTIDLHIFVFQSRKIFD